MSTICLAVLRHWWKGVGILDKRAVWTPTNTWGCDAMHGGGVAQDGAVAPHCMWLWSTQVEANNLPKPRSRPIRYQDLDPWTVNQIWSNMMFEAFCKKSHNSVSALCGNHPSLGIQRDENPSTSVFCENVAALLLSSPNCSLIVVNRCPKFCSFWTISRSERMLGCSPPTSKDTSAHECHVLSNEVFTT